MELIKSRSEESLMDMLEIIQQDPPAWMKVHVNMRNISDQMLEKNALSQKTLDQIGQKSVSVAKTLMDSELSEFDGKIFIFEDSDLLALFKKGQSSFLPIMRNLRKEFNASGLLSILSITDMADQLASLVELSQKKLESAEIYREKKRAVEVAGQVAGWSQPNEKMAQIIQGKRKQRGSGCALIIEDDVVARNMVALLLRDKFEVVQASETANGIISYIDKAPDIVFLDIHLPDDNGHEALRRIKLLDPQAYVVMLSGDSIPENVLSAKTRGAAGFIRKPFSKEKLLEYIRQCPTLSSPH